MQRRMLLLLLALAVALAPAPAGAASAGPPPASSPAIVPPFEFIPGLLAPVVLLMPWQCGDCAPGVERVEPRQVPDLNPYDFGSVLPWLVAQLYNNVAYPIICWALAIGQAVLNIAAFILNFSIIAAINFAYRLAIYGWLYARDTLLWGWGAFEAVRALLWDGWGLLLQFGELGLGLVRAAQELANLLADFIALLVALVLALVQPIAYLVALLLAVVPAFVQGVTNPTMPPQLAALDSFFLFVWLRQGLQAAADSRLGWAWAALIALYYVRFVSWLIDELAQFNS